MQSARASITPRRRPKTSLRKQAPSTPRTVSMRQHRLHDLPGSLRIGAPVPERASETKWNLLNTRFPEQPAQSRIPTVIDPSETETPVWIHPRFPRLLLRISSTLPLNLFRCSPDAFILAAGKSNCRAADRLHRASNLSGSCRGRRRKLQTQLDQRPSFIKSSRRPIAVPTSERCSGRRRCLGPAFPRGNASRASPAELLAALSRSSRSIQELKSMALLPRRQQTPIDLPTSAWCNPQRCALLIGAVGAVPSARRADGRRHLDGRTESRGARGIEIQPRLSALRRCTGIAERRATRGCQHFNRMRARPLEELIGVDAQALRPWFCETSELAGIDTGAQPRADARSKVSSQRQRCFMIAGRRNTTRPLRSRVVDECGTTASTSIRHRRRSICARGVSDRLGRSGIPDCRIASVAPRGVERVHKCPSRVALR